MILLKQVKTGGVVLEPILLVFKQTNKQSNILGPYLKLYNYDIIKVKTRGVVLEPILLVLWQRSPPAK